MKKLLLPLLIICFSFGLSGQTIMEKDLTNDLNTLGVTSTAMNALLIDGANLWTVPGTSWNNFRFLKTQGILRWNGSTLSRFSVLNSGLVNDSVFRLLEWDTSIIALTASGPQRFDGSKFVPFAGFGALSTSKIYDALTYGPLTLFATDKGLVVNNKGVITTYGQASGLDALGCSRILAMDGKVYGISNVSVFSWDTATKAISWPFITNYGSSQTDIAAFSGYLAIKSATKMDSMHYKMGFYKNNKMYQLDEVVARCEIQGAGLLSSSTRFFGQNDRLIINTFDVVGKTVFLDNKGARGYETTYDVFNPPIYALSGSEIVMVNMENGNMILRRAGFASFEENRSGIYKSVRQLKANNLGFAVGAANFNSIPGYKSTSILSRECLSTIFARALWIGARDNIGQIHTAATTYFQGGNNDFNPGPLDLAAKPKAIWKEKYNRVWPVSASDIDEHIAQFKKSGKVNNVATSIKEWPVYEIDGTDTIRLAPFTDVNRNGYYDPENGDYPLIKGDEAIYFVFNDSGSHTETHGLPLLLEVQGLVWAVHCPGWSGSDTFGIYDNTVFVEYKLINKGATAYKDVFLGQWNDIDLGNYADDYVGCMPNYNVAFGYNGDSLDESEFVGFGKNPPVQSMLFLEGPVADSDNLDNDNDGIKDNQGEQCLMASFMTYSNDWDTSRGNPNTAAGYYNLLQGKWLQGSPVVQGSDTVRFMFSHGEDPDHPGKYWTEANSFGVPHDNRFLTAAGPFTLSPGEVVKQVLAFNYMEAPYQKDPASQITKVCNILRDVYAREGWEDCRTAWLGTGQVMDRVGLYAYPIPTGDAITLRLEGYNGKARVGVYDVQGREQVFVQNQEFQGGESVMNIGGFSPGLYFVKLECQGATYSLRILKQ